MMVIWVLKLINVQKNQCPRNSQQVKITFESYCLCLQNCHKRYLICLLWSSVIYAITCICINLSHQWLSIIIFTVNICYLDSWGEVDQTETPRVILQLSFTQIIVFLFIYVSWWNFRIILVSDMIRQQQPRLTWDWSLTET